MGENIRGVPEVIKNQIKKLLPDKLCAVSKVIPLPKGYFIVLAITDYDKHQMDLYDNKGKYQRIIQFPDGVNPHRLRFKNDIACGIEKNEECDSYVEYKILNFQKIYDSSQ